MQIVDFTCNLVVHETVHEDVDRRGCLIQRFERVRLGENAVLAQRFDGLLYVLFDKGAESG